MGIIVEKVAETEVLVADFGSKQLYRIVETNEDSELESASESEG